MWKILLFAALPLVPLAAVHGGGAAESTGLSADAPLQCEIRAAPVSGGVELTGIATTVRPLSGTYELDVRKVGRAGTSNSMQSGEFEAAPGMNGIVGMVGLGLEPGASFSARLVLRWQGGELSCTATGPDEV